MMPDPTIVAFPQDGRRFRPCICPPPRPRLGERSSGRERPATSVPKFSRYSKLTARLRWPAITSRQDYGLRKVPITRYLKPMTGCPSRSRTLRRRYAYFPGANKWTHDPAHRRPAPRADASGADGAADLRDVFVERVVVELQGSDG